jgi:hypothetical protein
MAQGKKLRKLLLLLVVLSQLKFKLAKVLLLLVVVLSQLKFKSTHKVIRYKKLFQ